MASAFWQAEARFDWAEYLREHGAMRAIRSKAHEYLMVCPDCHKPKLAVNAAKKAWQCFACGESGREAASLIAKVEGLPWKDALIKVISGHQTAIGRIDKIADDPEPEPAPLRVPKQVPFPEGFIWLRPFGYGPAPAAVWPPQDAYFKALQYCHQRGIPGEVVEEMKLGVCTTGLFRGRVIFPCFDSGGRLIFYQGRATWAEHPRERRHIKTLSPKLEEGCAGPADCLLNLEFVQRAGYTRVLVTEGPIDCAHAWPDAVATWGKKISPRQIELLVRAGVRELDLCYDSDPPRRGRDGQPIPGGIEAMLKAAPELVDVFTVRVVHLPTGTDPGNYTKEEIEHFRSQATTWGTGERLMRL